MFEEGVYEETVHLRRSKKGVCGARNRVGIGLSYRPARLHRLVESIPWNQFLGSLNVYKFGLCTYFGCNFRTTKWRYENSQAIFSIWKKVIVCFELGEQNHVIAERRLYPSYGGNRRVGEIRINGNVVITYLSTNQLENRSAVRGRCYSSLPDFFLQQASG